MSDALICLEKVCFSYSKEPFLKEVSLSILPHEFVGIIGPNGSGKTTLLKLIMGLLQPNFGKVQIFGKSPEHSLSKIGYVPQVRIYDQKFPISVFDVVLMGDLASLNAFGSFPKKTKEKAFELLKSMDLLAIKDQSFGTLSGGQAQRVLIARALLSDPEVLFLDEPTVGLDVNSQNKITSLLAELKKKMTIVMVTHHLQSFIKHLDAVYCVQGDVTKLKPEQVCEHFALGVYHSPLIEKKGDSGCY